MFSTRGSETRSWKLIPLALTVAIVLTIAAFHAPTRSAAQRVMRLQWHTDESCPNAPSLAGTWVKAPSAPAACIVTESVVTSVGGCNFKIDVTVNGQPVTKFAVLHADGTIVEQNGDHHGQLLLNANPPTLQMADGCSYVEQTFGAINDFDGGGFHPSCSDKLLRAKDGLIAADAKLWWGKKSEGGMPLTQHALDQFRRGLKVDARTWSRGEGTNLIVSDDNRVARVDERKCQITDLYIPRADGELNERIESEVKSDPKAKCQRQLWHKLRRIYRSEIGKSRLQKREHFVDDLINLMPMSKDSKVFYVGQDGSLKSTSPRESQQRGLVKGSFFRMTHVRVDLLPDHPLKDKVVFLFANNMVVLGDYDPCEISGIYLPTVDGRVSLKLKTEV